MQKVFRFLDPDNNGTISRKAKKCGSEPKKGTRKKSAKNFIEFLCSTFFVHTLPVFFFWGGVDFKDMDVLWKQKREGIEVKRCIFLISSVGCAKLTENTSNFEDC